MKISVIGGGNMGGAIVRGLMRLDLSVQHEVSVADVSPGTLQRLSEDCPSVCCVMDMREIVSDADMIILAIKPWLYSKVIDGLVGRIDLSKQMVVSIAAGITLEDLRELFGVYREESPLLFRVMPNIAIEYCESISFVASEGASIEKIEAVFGQLGSVMELKESLFGAAMALGSCGIAFAMRYVRASATAGLELGLTADQSQAILVQTLRGVIVLLNSSDRHIESLIDSVCTPGGVTIKGLNAMEQEGFTRAVQAGIRVVGK